jgi:hypothetical protein
MCSDLFGIHNKSVWHYGMFRRRRWSRRKEKRITKVSKKKRSKETEGRNKNIRRKRTMKSRRMRRAGHVARM